MYDIILWDLTQRKRGENATDCCSWSDCSTFLWHIRILSLLRLTIVLAQWSISVVTCQMHDYNNIIIQQGLVLLIILFTCKENSMNILLLTTSQLSLQDKFLAKKLLEENHDYLMSTGLSYYTIIISHLNSLIGYICYILLMFYSHPGSNCSHTHASMSANLATRPSHVFVKGCKAGSG